MPLVQRSRIAELREWAGLTQVQLAALVGVTPNTIQNWEKPNGLDQLERYLKAAELFGCEVKELVEYVEIPDEEAVSKPKGFSLQDIRDLRERWGTSTTSNSIKQQNHKLSRSQPQHAIHLNSQGQMKLQQVRKEMGITLADLAKKSHVSVSTIKRFLSGQRISSGSFQALCEGLELTEWQSLLENEETDIAASQINSSESCEA